MREQEAPQGPIKEEFITHSIFGRKNLLQFVKEKIHPTILEDFKENPQGWLEELNIINQVLTGDPLVRGIGINQVPNLEGSDTLALGKDTYLYTGADRRKKGIWTKITSEDSLLGQFQDSTQWAHYSLSYPGELKIYDGYQNTPSDIFQPDNFEKSAKLVKDDRRPIYEYTIGNQDVFVKGGFINLTFGYSMPSHRLTNLMGAEKGSLRREKEIFIALSKKGIHVPKVVAHYQSPFEEYLFLEKVKGDDPSKYFETHRQEIIAQDAAILANLSLMGHRKPGFEDFDDKVFDGKDLFLIDADECTDLYAGTIFNFRKMVVNPKDTKTLEEFRDYQKMLFSETLRDTIFRYKDTLTKNRDDQALYIRAFFKSLGWPEPTAKQIIDITTFPENYITMESHMAMMSEE